MWTAAGHNGGLRSQATRLTMNNTLEQPSEREQIEMLLPWFVTGRLDPAEHARVSAYLAAHPDMRSQLELVREEQGETIAANEALPGAPAGALARLREAVAAEPQRRTLAGAGQSLWSEMLRLFSAPTPRAVQWAGAAAAILLLAQAVMIGGLVGSQQASRDYQTASGESAAGSTALVRFAPGITADKLATALRRHQVEVVRGPKPGGVFEVRLARQALTAAERKAALDRLKAEPDLIAAVVGE